MSTQEEPGVVEDDAPRLDVLKTVPDSLQVMAAWAWRIAVVGVVALALASGLAKLSTILVPLVISLLIAAPLGRFVDFLQKLKINRTLGSMLSIVGLVGSVLGLTVAAGASVVTAFGKLRESAIEGFDTIVEWLVTGPLHVSQDQIDKVIDQGVDAVRGNAWGLASGALDVTGTIGGLVAGTVLALLALFFFLKDGASMWSFFVGLLPKAARTSVNRAGHIAWDSVRRYTQTSVFVAFVDAAGIGIGAWILGIPLALPIAIVVFLFSFIPIFGAGLSGILAVLVALVDGGWVTAAIMLGIVFLVQQLEGNVLYPWLFGKAASVHPMAILLSISVGTLLAGLPGVIMAVPLLAFTVAFSRGLRKEIDLPESERHPLTGQIPVIAAKSRSVVTRVRSGMRGRRSSSDTEG